MRGTGRVTWVASPSALKHPINSEPSSALREHRKLGQQGRRGRSVLQLKGIHMQGVQPMGHCHHPEVFSARAG